MKHKGKLIIEFHFESDNTKLPLEMGAEICNQLEPEYSKELYGEEGKLRITRRFYKVEDSNES